MAYNRGYSGNPDALPAHAEPEQAAAMLSQNHPQRHHQSPAMGSAPQRYDNYPPPQQPQQPQRYGSGYGPSPGSAASGGPPPPRNAFASPPPPANYGQGP
ncbi:hypothetical protein KCU86_g22083, partial [Aureobasidium melanogenum]